MMKCLKKWSIAWIGGAIAWIWIAGSTPAIAANIDAYVSRYLQASSPVEIRVDAQGNARDFTPQALSQGKILFQKNCINCHVGGQTLPNPPVSLALNALQGATPARNNVQAIVDYLRHPLTYDGSEETFLCREVTENWMSQTEVENLAAFVLRAAEVAPGWGTQE